MRFYGFEKLSLVDYDDHLSCTLFCGGCNFACPFCHNSSLALSEDLPEPLTEAEIFDYLAERKSILTAVVVSGGEPTLYADLPDFIRKIKDMGYLVKLDTNGTNPKMLSKLIEHKLVDYVAMDVKSSKEGYALAVGKYDFDVTPVEESVAILKRGEVDYEFRATLVYELHSRGDIESMALWLDGAKKMRLQKFVDSGSCIAEGLTKVEEETAKEYAEVLRRHIALVELRGY